MQNWRPLILEKKSQMLKVYIQTDEQTNRRTDEQAERHRTKSNQKADMIWRVVNSEIWIVVLSIHFNELFEQKYILLVILTKERDHKNKTS